MYFDLADDDRALVSGIRDLLGARMPEPRPFDSGAWRELSDAGVFSIAQPETDGGLGLGITQAVLVFEELGRSLVAGPLVGTFLAAGLVDADVVGVTERSEAPVLVGHGEDIDALLVLDSDGVWRIDADGLDGDPVDQPLDPLSPLLAMATLPQGDRIAGADTATALRRDGAVLTAALLVGSADATTRMATEYAKQREQFGRTIGSFQAVKHLCADMLVRTEVARAAVYAAGVVLDDDSAGDAATAVAAAKLLASSHAIANGKACIQVHGGMGFTWEIAAHLHLKRAAVLATEFGSADEHAETLATAL